MVLKKDELFKLIKKTEYIDVGLTVDYQIKVDDEKKRIYLIFQQSHGGLDWPNNLDVAVVPYKNGMKQFYVHRGFVRAWKSANDIILGTLDAIRKQHEGYELLIIGWSHGAALAMLAAEDINFRSRKELSNPLTGERPKVITFGAPKFAFGKRTVEYFKDCIDPTSEEVCDRNDMVTIVQLPGYKHICKSSVGESFKLRKFFNPKFYHTSYDREGLYTNA